MYYSAGDFTYYYEVHGEGTPLVLLHGFTGSSITWKNLLGSKTPGIQFITVDLPGHGRTKGDRIKTMDECCHDLCGLFRMLKLDKFFLVGYSMGGRTALTYAARYPETIKGLVLESASPGLEDEAERTKRMEVDEILARRLDLEGLEAFVDYWESIPLFNTQKGLPKERKIEIRDERLKNNPRGLSHSLRGMGTGRQESNWDKLETIKFPVQLIVGELDKKFVTINEKMKEQILYAQLDIVKDAGHTIHVEKPETYGKLVTSFVKSLI